VADPETVVDDLAAAILDGSPIDWRTAESSLSAAQYPLLEELKLLATVADVHRRAGEHSVPFATWGHLRILERIGRGTFGEVYRAWDSRLDREVALKILPCDDDPDQHGWTSVIREGQLLARVRHPNVVTVYCADLIDNRIGVWMELIDGRTLDQVLATDGVFAEQQAMEIGIQLCHALAAVHDTGLLHRDVKAHNVMVAEDGRVVLMDFGAGREAEEHGSPDLTGTPLYLAPEVFDGQPASKQSDIYSLGVLLYHLVTGSYPVNGKTIDDLRKAHRSARPASLRDVRPDVRRLFVDIVERALARSPAARYRTAREMESALASVLERSRLGIGTRRRALLAAAALMVLGVAGSLWMMAPGGSEQYSIAVLPFRNLASAPDNQYFVDGLTGEIIRNLSVIDGLAVRSETSSFMFKGQPRDLRDVAVRLDANLVLEGSVLREGDQVRITAQLVDVDDDKALWSSRYDRKLEDIFTIQDEIARAIVNELRLQLNAGQRRYSTNLAAYDTYLRARAMLSEPGIASARQAIELLDEVVARDPSFAPAYAAMVSGWAAMSINYGGVPPDEGLARMEPVADKALQIDPLLAEAHAARGIVLARQRKWSMADDAFRRALGLNRNLSFIYTQYATSVLFPQGRLDDALEQLAAAVEVDPLSVDVRATMAWVQVSARRYPEAIDNSRRVLAQSPNVVHARQLLARALLHGGRVDEAIAIFQQQGRLSEGFLGYAYGVANRREEAEALAARNREFPARYALIAAGLGNHDDAAAALERMVEANDARVGIYLTYPEFSLLRDKAGSSALQKKLGLPRS
jgi:TolB-like protein/Flp pilus assembly protein TadD